MQQNWSLLHPQDLDCPMCVAAQRKTNVFKQTYADNQNISFLPVIMSTSNRMHGEFLRLLFLQAQLTAGPSTKLFAWGTGDSGGHVLRETTSRGLCGLVCPSHTGTREEPGTLTQGGALFSLVLVPLVWESNPKLQGGWCKTQPPAHQGI
jgi:hypothetical protein